MAASRSSPRGHFHDIRCGNRATLGRKDDRRPLVLLSAKLHVDLLNPQAGEVFFDVEEQSNQREHDRYRLGLLGRNLRAVSIHHELEDERVPAPGAGIDV